MYVSKADSSNEVAAHPGVHSPIHGVAGKEIPEILSRSLNNDSGLHGDFPYVINTSDDCLSYDSFLEGAVGNTPDDIVIEDRDDTPSQHSTLRRSLARRITSDQDSLEADVGNSPGKETAKI